MFRRLVLCLALLLPAVAAPPRAQEAGEPPTKGVATEIVDGDTLVLASGRQVRLVGIQAPKLPLGRPGFRTWPLADEAKAALAALAEGKPLTLSYGGRRTDRHGRLLAHLHDARGRWIQGELLAQGMARVYSFADNRAHVAEMLALEHAARAARRGIWAHPFYRVRTVAESDRFIDSFQLVEGRVLEVANVRGRAYLNFGQDWRRDFTIVVAPRDLRQFQREGVDVTALQGRRIRVRGWLKAFNGPMITATHPEQIEVLPE